MARSGSAAFAIRTTEAVTAEPSAGEPTFDQELLLWLGDEPEAVRAEHAALSRRRRERAQ